MIFGRTKLELKVGIFVFIGLIIFVFFILFIGGFKTWSSGYTINFNFNFINGVKTGAPVRFAGVDAGEVKKVYIEYLPEENRTNIRLQAWLRSNIKVPVDSRVLINTLGLLGEKYIEILPGNNYADCLQNNGNLSGIDPLPMDKVLKTAQDIMSNVNDSLNKIRNKEGTLGKLIYDDTIYNELEALVADVRRNPWKLFIKTKEKK
ncbi:MAG: MlaD family protein [Candidatus Omnitrophica bacterium]|jgi:phospholipid/cholesterol/gamma-HCH transport system substrate-binding protein|nr:MlaD family protein [Candidatus Omnitrophota bacterium]